MFFFYGFFENLCDAFYTSILPLPLRQWSKDWTLSLYPKDLPCSLHGIFCYWSFLSYSFLYFVFLVLYPDFHMTLLLGQTAFCQGLWLAYWVLIQASSQFSFSEFCSHACTGSLISFICVGCLNIVKSVLYTSSRNSSRPVLGAQSKQCDSCFLASQVLPALFQVTVSDNRELSVPVPGCVGLQQSISVNSYSYTMGKESSYQPHWWLGQK